MKNPIQKEEEEITGSEEIKKKLSDPTTKKPIVNKTGKSE